MLLVCTPLNSERSTLLAVAFGSRSKGVPDTASRRLGVTELAREHRAYSLVTNLELTNNF
jgi:hypothetical protein